MKVTNKIFLLRPPASYVFYEASSLVFGRYQSFFVIFSCVWPWPLNNDRDLDMKVTKHIFLLRPQASYVFYEASGLIFGRNQSFFVIFSFLWPWPWHEGHEKDFFVEASGLICILWGLRPHFRKKTEIFRDFFVFMTLTFEWGPWPWHEGHEKDFFVEASGLICILWGLRPHFRKKPEFFRDFFVFMTLTLTWRSRKRFFVEAFGLICILWGLRPHFRKKPEFFRDFFVFMTLTFKWRSRKIDKVTPGYKTYISWKYELNRFSGLGGVRGHTYIHTDREISAIKSID